MTEAEKFLDYMDTALRMGDHGSVIFAAFVWTQRRDYITAGEETFEDQKLREPVFGGIREWAERADCGATAPGGYVCTEPAQHAAGYHAGQEPTGTVRRLWPIDAIFEEKDKDD